jgi:hypothetical protein
MSKSTPNRPKPVTDIQVPTAKNSPEYSILEEVAVIFIDIHLDTIAKRDLAVWFAEHADSHYTKADLNRVLGHNPATVVASLRALQEAGAVTAERSDLGPIWQLTPDIATRAILQAVTLYFRQHPGARTMMIC